MTLLAGRSGGQMDHLARLFGVTLVLLTCYVAFLMAERISKIITGHSVSTRMLGIILAALAVQFIIDWKKEG